MDNIFSLKKGDNVVIRGIDDRLKEFSLTKESEKFLNDFVNENVGESFKVDMVFGNKILLSNGVFVFDFHITPDRDIDFSFNCIRNSFSMNVNKDVFAKIATTYPKKSFGFGFEIKEDELIVPYGEELDDSDVLFSKMKGYLQVEAYKTYMTNMLSN